MSEDLKKRIKDLEDLVEQLDKTLNLYRELSYINLPVVDLVHQANKMGKEMTAKEISEFIFLRSNDRIKRYALLLHNPSIKLTPRETQYVEMMIQGFSNAQAGMIFKVGQDRIKEINKQISKKFKDVNDKPLKDVKDVDWYKDLSAKQRETIDGWYKELYGQGLYTGKTKRPITRKISMREANLRSQNDNIKSTRLGRVNTKLIDEGN